LACKNTIQESIHLIEDLRQILILEEEILPNYGCLPVVFVATPDELGVNPTTGIPSNNLFITNGTQVFELFTDSMAQLDPPNGPYVTTGVEFVIRTEGRDITYGPNSAFKVENFGVIYLECTGEYLPVTRPTRYACKNPFSVSLIMQHGSLRRSYASM